MTRLTLIRAACLLAAVAIGYGMGLDDAAKSAPIAPAMDPWGSCTPEAALDDPETWAATGKGSRLAHTCLDPDTPPDPALFARSFGYTLPPEEWSRAVYLGMLARGERPFVPVDELPAPAVPLPPPVWLMLAGLAGLLAARLLGRRSREEGATEDEGSEAA